MATTDRRRRRGGFTRTGGLLSERIRAAAESRGFADARVLTQWDEIAGPEIARAARPVDVRFGRGSIGATLTLLTTGAQAQMVEMAKPALRERINACYGYAAIARIRLTQTAPSGFAEGQAAYASPPKAPKVPSAAAAATANTLSADVGDDALRRALETLGRNILSSREDTT